ncbi:MAG: DUF262 domain-containing HNH endonuclease family protein [Gammaproteobacteria bacterium]|nr:DUF262 domain-containing HNH endonuclease family protein [Gammaproteobacteria bacterium]
MPTNNDLVLKPVNELLSESFYIPAYQRGYRWTRRQVTELLDDIYEFQKQSEESSKSAFYCLQPVVVKKRDGEWELVDGQQRLTTIHIILSYLKDILAMIGKERYSLRYETRPDSAIYLEDIDESRHMDNVDFYYMYEARQAIQEWFEARDGTYKIKFVQTLLNDDDSGKNVKVIWYQINEDTDVTAVFTRLNLGKIPLTNAELIKALFLKGSNFNDSDRYLGQLRIAQEWDEIERALQSDDFWFFISNKKMQANRIEFVLDLVAGQLTNDDQAIPKYDPFFVFLTFSRWLSESDESIERNWEKVKRCFMTLREWHEDRTIFHLIGYLVSTGAKVNDLLNDFQVCATKQEYRHELANMVFKRSMPGLKEINSYESRADLRQSIDEYLAELSYGSPRPQLVSALLLFNVATLLANAKTNVRFQFDRFKNESWDIEHIRSVASEIPKSKDRQKAWLEGVADYIENEVVDKSSMSEDLSISLTDILKSAKDIIAGKTFDSVAFESLFTRVLEIYVPDGNEETDHSIGNLTLLDSSTNRSYQNAIFPIKRNRIIRLDKTATFVPVCTKNAFLKYYSDRVDNMMFWHARDSENHQSAMVEMLTTLFVVDGVTA